MSVTLYLLLLLGSSAQPSEKQAQNALDAVVVEPCIARPEWALREAWLFLTVLPTSELVFTVHLSPQVWGADEPQVRACLEGAARFNGQSWDSKPSRPILVWRRVRGHAAQESAELKAALERARQSILECYRSRSDSFERRTVGIIDIEVSGDGGVRAVRPSGQTSSMNPRTLGQCLTPFVSSLEPGAARATFELNRDKVPAGLPLSDGSRGAVCDWGKEDEAHLGRDEHLPQPKPCGKGLNCCYGGGVKGLRSYCMEAETGGCPRHP